MVKGTATKKDTVDAALREVTALAAPEVAGNETEAVPWDRPAGGCGHDVGGRVLAWPPGVIDTGPGW